MLESSLRDQHVCVHLVNGRVLAGLVLEVTHGHLCLQLPACEGDERWKPLSAARVYVPHTSPTVELISVVTVEDVEQMRREQRGLRPASERWANALGAMTRGGELFLVLHAQPTGLVLRDHEGNSSLYRYPELEQWRPVLRAEVLAWATKWLLRNEVCQRIVAAAKELDEALAALEAPADLQPMVTRPVHEWLKLLGQDLQVASAALDLHPYIPTREELEAEGDAWREEMEPEATSFGDTAEQGWRQERPPKPVIVDPNAAPWGWVDYLTPCAKCGEPVKVPIKREEPPSEGGDARAVAQFLEFLDPEEVEAIRHDACEEGEDEVEQTPEGNGNADT